jgi:SAM-dependent methyltransferase
MRVCSEHYRGRLPVARFDALFLPFKPASFDAVVMFEAIYYLSDVGRFLEEARQILRPGGIVLLALPNKDWPGFSRSPKSFQYFSPPELEACFREHLFSVEVFGTFAQERVRPFQRLLGAIRKVGTNLGLVPQTHARTELVRSLLKRILYGRLEPVPSEIGPDLAVGCERVQLPTDRVDSLHRVLYAVARMDDGLSSR